MLDHTNTQIENIVTSYGYKVQKANQGYISILAHNSLVINLLYHIGARYDGIELEIGEHVKTFNSYAFDDGVVGFTRAILYPYQRVISTEYVREEEVCIDEWNDQTNKCIEVSKDPDRIPTVIYVPQGHESNEDDSKRVVSFRCVLPLILRKDICPEGFIAEMAEEKFSWAVRNTCTQFGIRLDQKIMLKQGQ